MLLLLLARVDIGTTLSAVSVTHCVRGQVPKPRVVNRWPSSPNSSKIPSVILYDQKGKARAFAAEAMTEQMQMQAEDEGWFEARWFKLHLHPQVKQSSVFSKQKPDFTPPRLWVLRLIRLSMG